MRGARGRLLSNILGGAAGLLGALLLCLNVAWWAGEAAWGRFVPLEPEAAFADGTFGLEFAPLKWVLVSSEVSAVALEPEHVPWPKRFGFLARPGTGAGPCEKDAPGNLPVGFGVSNRLPGSAYPVPTRFVGLTCAACHASAPAGKVLLGPGSQTADVIAFTDAFLNATLDDRLTADAVLAAYDRRCPEEAAGLGGFVSRELDRFFIGSWLKGARAAARVNETKYDMAFHGADLGDPSRIPTGPSRTRPFRSVVRNSLDLPGADNRAYSKVPLAAMQGGKHWSQFDGSVGDPVVRSMVAVFTSGASVAALNDVQITDNVKKAARYTLNLGQVPALPTLSEAFPGTPPPPQGAIARGRLVYGTACAGCHGSPGPAGWLPPPGAPDPFITPVGEIGTDPRRLDFRYARMLPSALAGTLPLQDVDVQARLLLAEADAAGGIGDEAARDWWLGAARRLDKRSREFPAGHRLAFSKDDVAYRQGFQNAPIMFAWLRAPYLHNASVPTLRQLIGLDARPVAFCRGANDYDPSAIGLAAPEPGAGGCPPATPFLFDARVPGNSNAGHEYPKPGTASREDLESLLAYLGTL